MTDELSARLEVARALAREIISGQLAPLEGARQIAQQRSEGLDHLGIFGDLVGEWERDESGREDCDRKILEEASLLLADTA